MNKKTKEYFKVTKWPVVIASLCCLSPLVLVAFGLATVSFASSFADALYYDYRWVFRIIGLVLLAGSIILYFRNQKGICTIDEAKKRRREIINKTLIFLILGVLGYIIFLYGIVHYAGVFLGIWDDYSYFWQ